MLDAVVEGILEALLHGILEPLAEGTWELVKLAGRRALGLLRGGD